MPHTAIELRGVTKRFGSRLAVRQLDLDVPEGSLYGFIGPNGSGKTTTLRMILCILLPSEGSVRVLGTEHAPAADNRTGYLPEERGLYRRMRVAEVLELFARLKGVARPAIAVARWLERLGLEERARDRVESLSKGLSQRVQFAAAVVHDPRLLILDEPLSGLDPVSADALRDTILELRRAGTTIVLSTHDMAIAERTCDSVMMIHAGRKVLDGTLAEVTSARGGERVRVRFDAEVDVQDHPGGVREWRAHGRDHHLLLEPGCDTQALLRELMTRGPISRFEVARASLHELFVGIAGPGAPSPGPALSLAGAERA
jgi:ABC-2 type transport system ATP-binding protein